MPRHSATGGKSDGKRKGVATLRLSSGRVRRAELHWYEAHGVGRVNMKVERFLD
jgi:hypothetical protein